MSDLISAAIMPVYIVFDGPPGPESGRFVEVEDMHGNSVDSGRARWTHCPDGYWRLGPFTRQEAPDSTEE